MSGNDAAREPDSKHILNLLNIQNEIYFRKRTRHISSRKHHDSLFQYVEQKMALANDLSTLPTEQDFAPHPSLPALLQRSIQIDPSDVSYRKSIKQKEIIESVMDRCSRYYHPTNCSLSPEKQEIVLNPLQLRNHKYKKSIAATQRDTIGPPPPAATSVSHRKPSMSSNKHLLGYNQKSYRSQSTNSLNRFEEITLQKIKKEENSKLKVLKIVSRENNKKLQKLLAWKEKHRPEIFNNRRSLF